MKISASGEHLYQLTRMWAFNCYLVREEDGFTLVDTNLPGSAEAIVKAAQSLQAPIARILLTHAHGDHVGSVDALHALLPEAEVIISARDARFLKGDRSLDANEPQVKLRGSYQVIATTPTRLLQPGERVGSLEAVASAGHTPGHLAFLDVRDRSLIAGDAFQTQGGLAVAGVIRPLFPLPAMATWHLELALSSARALRALEPARMAVGHGPVLEAPLAAMDRAIAAAQANVERHASHAA